jgi:hypothetical protein
MVRKADELVVLGLLLPRAKLGVVEVLTAPGLVDPGRLELGVSARRNPDVTPGRRNDERLDPLDLLGVRDRLSA